VELTDYLRIFRKRGWIVILVALVAAASAFAFSKLQTPVYSASVKLSVNPARADWGLSNATKDLLRNYAENIRTHTMAQEVIDRAQLDMDTTTLLGKLFVSPAADTFTLQLDARDTDPEVAMTIAQTMAEVFDQHRCGRTVWPAGRSVGHLLPGMVGAGRDPLGIRFGASYRGDGAG
jgi:capsular polysaccharide biosynthesis protein